MATTSLPTVNLSSDTTDQIAPHLKSMRDSMDNQTKILQATFDLTANAARKAQMAANLAQSKATAKITKQAVTESVASKGADGGDGGSGGMGMGMMGLGSGIVAIAASLTGFDAAIKAMALPGKFKTFNMGWTKFTDEIVYMGIRIEEFGKKVKAFRPRFPDMPKISFVDAKGMPYDFTKTKLSISVGPKIDLIKAGTNAFFDSIQASINTKWTMAAEAFGGKITGIKTAANTFFDGIKLGMTEKFASPIEAFGGKITAIKNSINGFFDGVKLGMTEKFAGPATAFGDKLTSIKNSVGTFFDKIPRIKLTMPVGLAGITDSVKTAFGAIDGGGILGFLGKVGGFLKPLLAPFEIILKTVMRPFTQVLLSIIDFVTGFYQGFTSEDGSFGDKLKAGIEGGIKGIIKGFTEAIDLIFIKLPAWLMEKLGFDGIAETLKSFSLTALVDPAWEAVKNFFKKMFTDPGGTVMGIAKGAGEMGENFIKSILRMILPDPDADRAWYDPRGLVAKAIPNSVYTYAGLDAKTGEMLPGAASSRGDAITALAVEADAMGRADSKGSQVSVAAPVIAPVNNVNVRNQNTTLGMPGNLSNAMGF